MLRWMAVLLCISALAGCEDTPRAPEQPPTRPAAGADSAVVDDEGALADDPAVARFRATDAGEAMQAQGEELFVLSLGRDYRSVWCLCWLTDETLLVVSRYPGGSATRTLNFATVSTEDGDLTPIGEVPAATYCAWHVFATGDDRAAWVSLFRTYPQVELAGTLRLDLTARSIEHVGPPEALRDVPLFADTASDGERLALSVVPRLRVLDGLGREVASASVPDDLYVYSALSRPMRTPDGAIAAALRTARQPDVGYTVDEPATDVSVLQDGGGGEWQVARTLRPAGSDEVPSPIDDDVREWCCLDCPGLSADAGVVCARERLEFEGPDCVSVFGRILVWRSDGSRVVVCAWGRCCVPWSDRAGWRTACLLGDNPAEPAYAHHIGPWEGRPAISPGAELVAWAIDGRVHVVRVP